MRCSRNQTNQRTGWDKGKVSSKTKINDGEEGLMRDLRCLKILIFRKKGLNVLLKKRQKSAFIQMVKPFTKETEDSYQTKQF